LEIKPETSIYSKADREREGDRVHPGYLLTDAREVAALLSYPIKYYN
jgi:hypothetical protein